MAIIGACTASQFGCFSRIALSVKIFWGWPSSVKKARAKWPSPDGLRPSSSASHSFILSALFCWFDPPSPSISASSPKGAFARLSSVFSIKSGKSEGLNKPASPNKRSSKALRAARSFAIRWACLRLPKNPFRRCRIWSSSLCAASRLKALASRVFTECPASASAA